MEAVQNDLENQITSTKVFISEILSDLRRVGTDFRIRVNLFCANTSNFNLFSCGSNLTKATFCLYSIVNPTNTTDPFSNRFFFFYLLLICIFALKIFYSIFPPENWHLFSFATSSFFLKENKICFFISLLNLW